MLYAGETAPPPEDGEALTDTWLFAAGRGWTESLAQGPGLWGTSPVLDGQSGRAILLANVRGFADTAPETWSYDPGADNWRRMAPAEMPAWGVLAYDAESDRTHGMAGCTASSSALAAALRRDSRAIARGTRQGARMRACRSTCR